MNQETKQWIAEKVFMIGIIEIIIAPLFTKWPIVYKIIIVSIVINICGYAVYSYIMKKVRRKKLKNGRRTKIHNRKVYG